eukprot:11252167-Ditylum_brightwellii.AAC.1
MEGGSRFVLRETARCVLRRLGHAAAAMCDGVPEPALRIGLACWFRRAEESCRSFVLCSNKAL